jgi:hypothetical protein
MRHDKNVIDEARLARAKKMIESGVNKADIARSWGMTRSALGKALDREKQRMVGRVAEGTALEKRQTETSRGFESDTIRQRHA